MATSLVRAESPSKAEEKPARHGMQAQPCAELTAKQDLQKNFSISSSEDQRYANPPTGVGNANLAAARGDVTTGSAAATSSNGAARVLGNWADYTEDQRPGEDDDFTVVRNKRRRRDSPGSPTAAKHHSNPRGAGANSRPRSSTGWVPRAEEIKTTRAHIAEARARQASSAEDNCVYVEYIPELEPYHYIRAVDRKIGGTNNVFQVSKINGHYLMGLNNRSLAERLISEGLEVEGTLFRAFPFRKRAMKITVGNLPFFVEDFTIISALTPYGRVTSIAPKLMKAGPYIYNDGRRDAFIVLHEGVTTERLPTRLEIKIKGEVWPAYLSYGIRCSRCHGQGHRRANCPLLAGRSNAPRPATPTSPTGVPPVTTPRPPQPPSAQPPPPASPSPAMEVSEVPSTSRAALHPPAAPRQSPPVAPAIPTEMAPPAPPPVTPAPSLRAPGSHGPAVPTLDVEMSIEETSTSSTSSSGTSTREGLVTFLERNPGVSFAQTDALGLGREEVLDLLSSKTKARKRGPLLSPSQGDALAGLIRQLLGLKPGGNSNIYKVLGQVRAALKTSPAAVPPTPPLPAPQPAGPIPPAPDEEEMTPIMREECMVIEIFKKLKHLTCLRPLYQSGIQPNDLKDAILFIDERESLMARLTPAMRGVLAEFLSAAIEPARGNHPDVSSDLAKEPSRSAEQVPERPSTGSQPGEELSPKKGIIENSSLEFSMEYRTHASPPAREAHGTLAAARGDVTAPPTAASSSENLADPASLNWADSEMAEVDANDDYTVVKSKKRRLSSTPEQAAKQASRPAEKRGSQQQKRTTGPRSMPPQEIKATRANIADARARQANTNHENYVFVELCPDIPDYSYLRAIGDLVEGPKNIAHFGRMNGHYIVGLASKNLASRLVEEGLNIEETLLKVFPFRKRAERIIVANLPGFVEDATIVQALREYGDITSIAPIMIKMGEFAFSDGRREAFILLREGVRLETLPTRLTIHSKGDTLSAFLSFGIKCSKCGKQGHRRANCPALARQGNGSPRQAASPTDARPPLPPPQRPRKPAPAPATPASPVQPAKTSAEAQAIPSAHQPAEQIDLTHPAPAAHPAHLAALRPPEPRIPPLDQEMSVEKLSSPPATPARGKAALEQLLEHLGKSPNPSIDWDKLPDLNCEEAQKLLTSETTMKRRAPTLTEEQFTALEKLHETIKALCPDSNSTACPSTCHPCSVPAGSWESRTCSPYTGRTSGSAGKEPGRPSIPSPTGGQKLQKDEIQKTISRENSENRENANPPAGVKDVNLAAARDVTLSLPASTSFNGAARVLGNWADCIEDLGPEADDAFTVVKGKNRRRESTNSPTAAAPSSNIGGARTSRRPQSSAGSVPRAQEIRTTRAHISEARARQASSSEEHCVYLEHGPELQPFHYLRALDRMLGGTAGVIQVSKVNGHQLLGLANRGLAERLINEGLEVEGTLLRAFPFRKRAERITVGNLPFFVEDSAIISALKPYGRVTSIAPKLMKAGPYTYNEGRREAFIVLHDGVTTERLPTRLDIPIKGEAWPAYLSSGIKCSRCHGQGHRRVNCPLLAGRANTTRSAPPASPAGLQPTTTPAPPQRPTPQHSAPAPPLEISGASPAARAAIHPAGAPRPSPTAPSASLTEETPPAPPPVTPDPSSQAPRDPASQEILGPTNITQDIEMTAVEESIPPSASSNKKCTRIDLAAFIKRSPSVSFAGTDALGLGREEVLDLLSSRTKAHKRGRHLTPPQSNALAGLVNQILDLRPGGDSNSTIYKVLRQVLSELRTGTAAVPPAPTLPAPRPAEPAPPAPQKWESTPAMATPPPPPSAQMESTTSRRASPPSTTGLPPSTAPGLPGPSPAAPTPPAPTSPAIRLSGAQPDARAVSPPSTAPQPTTPAPPASSVHVAAPAPPPEAPAPEHPASPRSAATEPTPPARPDFTTPCGPLPAQGTLGPATHTPDDDMITTEETSASSPAAVISTLPLPAPQPAGPIPPAPDEEEMTPIMREECMVIEILKKLKHLTCLRPLYQSGIQPNDLKDAILFIDERESLMARLTPAMRGVLAEFLSAAIEPARGNHPD
ncbi:hypothetical protein LAZ67_14002159, partial [Cordylochernes scorpioides]